MSETLLFLISFKPFTHILDFAQVYGLWIMIKNDFQFIIDPIKITLFKHNAHVHMNLHMNLPLTTSFKNVHSISIIPLKG